MFVFVMVRVLINVLGHFAEYCNLNIPCYEFFDCIYSVPVPLRAVKLLQFNPYLLVYTATHTIVTMFLRCI